MHRRLFPRLLQHKTRLFRNRRLHWGKRFIPPNTRRMHPQSSHVPSMRYDLRGNTLGKGRQYPIWGTTNTLFHQNDLQLLLQQSKGLPTIYVQLRRKSPQPYHKYHE